MIIKKRSKGKIKGCLGIRQMFKYYKENYDKNADYKEFSMIIKECNKDLIDHIINKAEIVLLPYRLGEIQVAKFERGFNKPKNKWSVDWQKTRELGFKVFFDSKFIYKIMWKKHIAIVKNKTGYKFNASRQTSRLVKPALLNKVDYYKI